MPAGSAGSNGADAAAASHAELRARHDEALRAAVSTLHAYLAALPAEDRARADAYWIHGTPPAETGKADLRRLPSPPRAFRVQNRAPKPLDALPVPAAVEIPVELRLGVDGEPLRRYSGWYRLQRTADGDRWEITAAAIDALPRPE